MMRWKRTKGIALLLILALALTGCGALPEWESSSVGGTIARESSSDITEEISEEEEEEEVLVTMEETEDVKSGSSSVAEVEEPVEETVVPVSGNTLTIGEEEQMTGEVYPYWNSTHGDDMAFRMCYGYHTVVVNKKGRYAVDPQVVTDFKEEDLDNGNRVFTITLAKDLLWSDGTPITAKDYVFHILFFSSPEVAELGASNVTYGRNYLGYNSYRDGDTVIFEGVHLIDDYTFSVTVDSESLPEYYDLALADVMPSDYRSWLAEGMDILDDGAGCYFSGGFKHENLEETVTACRESMKRCSGPYVIESFNVKDQSYILTKNTRYKGNYEGQKPYLEKVVIRKVDNAATALTDNLVDIITEVSGKSKNRKALKLCKTGTHRGTVYRRNGYTKLMFRCDDTVTGSSAVRKAFAYSLDREGLAKAYAGKNATVINSMYGLSQWMADDSTETIAGLNTYSLDVAKAKELLEKDGWIYAEDGSPYTTGVRYKNVNGSFVPLEIRLAVTKNTRLTSCLTNYVTKSETLAEAGFSVKKTNMAFREVLRNLSTDKSEYNTFALSQNFSTNSNFTSAYRQNGPYNLNRIVDSELQLLSSRLNSVWVRSDMTRKELKAAKAQYLANWQAFITYWNEALPDLPLFSERYHDYWKRCVIGYEHIRDGYWELPEQIVYVWKDTDSHH